MCLMSHHVPTFPSSPPWHLSSFSAPRMSYKVLSEHVKAMKKAQLKEVRMWEAVAAYHQEQEGSAGSWKGTHVIAQEFGIKKQWRTVVNQYQGGWSHQAAHKGYHGSVPNLGESNHGLVTDSNSEANWTRSLVLVRPRSKTGGPIWTDLNLLKGVSGMIDDHYGTWCQLIVIWCDTSQLILKSFSPPFIRSPLLLCAWLCYAQWSSQVRRRTFPKTSDLHTRWWKYEVEIAISVL
jgi:hypothetical protein